MRRSKLNLVIGDFFEYKTEQHFNLVIACEVLEHVEHDLSFLRKAHDLLENGGMLILSVPAKNRYWSIHDEVAGHLRRYERETLKGLLSEAGFLGIQLVSYGFPFLNMLRIPRVLLAKYQASSAKRMSIPDRTKESAFSQYRMMWKGFGLICNKHTVKPFSIFASFFNNNDLSNGYIAIARKPEKQRVELA